VGTFAVQIAKSFGADVTAVCSPGNVATAQTISADQVIDYTREDFTQNEQKYDLIFAVNGYHPILKYRRILNPRGVYVLAGASSAHIFSAIFQAVVIGRLISRSGGQKLGFMGIAEIKQEDLVTLKELLEAGKIVPVIDRRYPLSETVEAVRYLAQGHARGKVIITME
jgi:NADPH:quinone reductase-like Zn-dependent oxidoreductase